MTIFIHLFIFRETFITFSAVNLKLLLTNNENLNKDMESKKLFILILFLETCEKIIPRDAY